MKVIWQGLIRVENALGVQHGLDVTHERHSLLGFTVVDVVPLLEAQSMLGTDAAVVTGRPLVDEWFDGLQEGGVFSRGGDVQVQVTVT